ncbi:MAG: 3-dehydroshikimate dehydratase, partial [Acinetobacter sp.]|nr:3-dehydroshikimate dehydratase [Acinetobacter sp.]
DQRLGAIVFAVPALEHAGFVGSRGGGVVIEAAKLQKTCTQSNEQGCNAIPNQNILAPRLSYNKGQVTATVQGQPNQRYHVEFFANLQANGQEAEQYLGAQVVKTNAQGQGQTTWKTLSGAASVTANVTDHLGATSELSPAVHIK